MAIDKDVVFKHHSIKMAIHKMAVLPFRIDDAGRRKIPPFKFFLPDYFFLSAVPLSSIFLTINLAASI